MIKKDYAFGTKVRIIKLKKNSHLVKRYLNRIGYLGSIKNGKYPESIILDDEVVFMKDVVFSVVPK